VTHYPEKVTVFRTTKASTNATTDGRALTIGKAATAEEVLAMLNTHTLVFFNDGTNKGILHTHILS